jgi:chaperonin GroES
MIKPIGNKILVKPSALEEKTKGGLYLAKTDETPKEGVILALGKGGWDNNGQRIPFDVQVGDKILFTKYSGGDIEYNGEKYKLITEEEIAAVIN